MRTSSTEIRIPRTIGLPPKTPGLKVTLLRDPSFVIRRPRAALAVFTLSLTGRLALARLFAVRFEQPLMLLDELLLGHLRRDLELLCHGDLRRPIVAPPRAADVSRCIRDRRRQWRCQNGGDSNGVSERSTDER